MASTGHRESKKKRKREEEMRKREEKTRKREKVKRKREEDSESGLMIKRRGEIAGLLEDDGPRPGSSQDPVTSSPYPDFYVYRLTIHQVLGRGGFGKVVLASFPGRNTFMAVKVVLKTPDNTAMLMRERRILQTARECPFLCHLYAAHQSQHGAYFITEYLSGGSLQALIRMCGSLNIDNVRFYTAEIVCGLQFLHGHNIIHRDLKPGNIMLDRSGHIRIIDLGLARDGVTSSNKTRGVVGTTCFMAPEVLLDEEYDAAVDWWSLGIVVSIMSSGYSPFYYGPIRSEAVESIITEMPEIPPWLASDLKHLIKNLLRKNPEMRLGVSGNIRHHPFFDSIGWEDLEAGRAQPPFTPFRAVLKNKHLQWPGDETPTNPVAEFSYMSPSWARMMERSRL
ncbi:protein kinase C theta type-like [Engystomops pustulosus]|uniref:protein kinase C theta type-like n=1 Tax=Engystomops pustulosus TaxID=76066 RepID=UPI003AFB6BC3